MKRSSLISERTREHRFAPLETNRDTEQPHTYVRGRVNDVNGRERGQVGGRLTEGQRVAFLFNLVEWFNFVDQVAWREIMKLVWWFCVAKDHN